MKYVGITAWLCTTIILLCQISRPAEALRILGIFPYQTQSHTVMCVELMKELARRGHVVDVYSHFPLKENLTNYTDFSLKGTLPQMSNKLTYNEFLKMSISPWNFLRKFVRKSAHDMCQLFSHPHFQKLLHDPPNDPPYDLVIIEYCQTHCYIPWGRRFKVPIIGIVTLPSLDWIYGPAGSPVYLATDPSIFSPYATPMTFFERVHNLLIYYMTTFTLDNIIDEQDQYIQKYFGPDYPRGKELAKDFSLILLNHSPVINGIKFFAPSIVPVGGLHIVDYNETLPKDVQIWLDSSIHGCVYFSFGSMIRVETFPKHMLDAFYRTFENIAPVRVLWKIALPEDLPEGLPSNVVTHSWLPQIQVLKHKNVKVFITHGGLMGTQESINYGVPMIVIPLFADQYFNAQSYSQKNIAIKVELEEISEERLTGAVNDLLSNPKYVESINKVSKMFRDRPMTAMETATYWVEYVSRNGNDTLISPFVNMSWWQSMLVDVYAFIIALVAIVLYVLVKILQFVLSFTQLGKKACPLLTNKKSN